MTGWQVKTLGDVLKLEYGKPLPKEERDDNGAYPAYGANGIKCRTNQFYCDRPSIIVGRKGSAGEVNLTEEKFWPLDVTYFVGFDESQYDLMFLYYCLVSKNLQSLAKGVKPGINRNDVYDIECALPPLPEQKRIVAILDEAFAGISQAVANAEKNLANARELFESYLNVKLLRVASEDLAQTLSDVTELIVDCEHKTAPTQDAGYPSIRTPNIGKGELILDRVNRVSEETYNLWTRRAIPIPGDLILAREAPAGNIGVIPEGEKVCLGQRTVLIRTKKNIISPYYFAYLILHPITQMRLLSHSTGATVQHVNMKDIRRLSIGSLPSLKVQHTDVKVISEARTYFNQLETIFQQKLTALAELKQSILQKAFAGELH